MKDKINISVEHSKKLQSEFQTTDTTVRMALKYVFNSEKAKAIRARAKELLIEEASKIKDETNEGDKE